MPKSKKVEGSGCHIREGMANGCREEQCSAQVRYSGGSEGRMVLQVAERNVECLV